MESVLQDELGNSILIGGDVIHAELKKWTGVWAKILSYSSITVSVVMVGGLALRIEPIYQFSAALPPIKFNTALGLSCSGFALLCLETNRCWAAQALILIVLLFAGVNLVQHLFHIDLHIDQLFIRSASSDRTFFPGRTSINSTVSFIFFGIGLLLLTLKNVKFRHWIAGGLGACNIALALTALIGQILDVQEIYGWNDLSLMAPQSAVMFLLLGSGLFLMAMQCTNPDESIGWIFFLCMVGTLIFSLSLIKGFFYSARTNVLSMAQLQVADIILLISYLFSLTIIGFLLYRFIQVNVQLHITQRDVQKNLETKTTVLHVVGHEIRNPLNAVLGFAELLMAESQPSEIKRYSQSIHVACDHILRLVDNLLAYAKYDAGTIGLDIIEFDTRMWAEHLISFLEKRVAIVKMCFVYHIDHSLPNKLQSDREKLTQIIFNFTENAINHSKKGDKIELYLEYDSPRLRIRVRDHGEGIPFEQQAKLFQMFHQVERAKGIQGTGIGLALCKTYADMMQGDVGIESIPGEGSEFYCMVQCKTVGEHHE